MVRYGVWAKLGGATILVVGFWAISLLDRRNRFNRNRVHRNGIGIIRPSNWEHRANLEKTRSAAVGMSNGRRERWRSSGAGVRPVKRRSLAGPPTTTTWSNRSFEPSRMAPPRPWPVSRPGLASQTIFIFHFQVLATSAVFSLIISVPGYYYVF